MTPEHQHLVLNHIPIIGSACAILPLVAGFYLRNAGLLLTGLLLAAVCGWTTPFVMESGEEAEHRYEMGAVRPYLDAHAEDFVEEHGERAEKGSKVMYVSAILATICLVAARWCWPVARWGALVVAVACLMAMMAGIWIADAGGKIRRVDFREGGGAVSAEGQPAEGQADEH